MTEEEREKRKAERKRERHELHEQQQREAPLAFLTHYKKKLDPKGRDDFLTLILPSGRTTELNIRYRGDDWFLIEDDWGTKVAEMPHFFDDLHELARLIRALTVRYNTMARSINETVRETPPMEALESFSAQEGAAS